MDKLRNEAKVEISEAKTDFMCPECGVALEFKRRVFSKKQEDEQKEYYTKMIKTKLFRYLKIGPTFRVLGEAMEMRCPKCQRLYHVEKES